MPKWSAKQKLDPVNLGTKKATVSVERDDSAFGRLQIGKATLTWKGKGKQKGKRLSWEELAQLFERHGRTA